MTTSSMARDSRQDVNQKVSWNHLVCARFPTTMAWKKKTRETMRCRMAATVPKIMRFRSVLL